MRLVVQVEGHPDRKFDDLPLAAWEAPRYLEPGKAISCKARIDTGDLAQFLSVRPLAELSLRVSGVLDPIWKDETYVGAIPAVEPAPATVARAGLLGQFDRSTQANWASAYDLALTRIVRDMKRGDLPARMAAARKVGSLIAMVTNVGKGEVKLAAQLEGVIAKPVLLSMLRAVLRDPSPAVRAEVLAALRCARMDAGILVLLPPAIEDPSPLVRMKVAELLGGWDAKGNEVILAYLAADSDELVRLMAKSLLPK